MDQPASRTVVNASRFVVNDSSRTVVNDASDRYERDQAAARISRSAARRESPRSVST
ncbi:hypothetical protein J2S43_003067 [Catenuloplanes nepalensis]|uniref:Uncharacterized protein n=1 Tax=Catenuloplanes nepalensis TaxID=587533 RepID=A0ABT9MSY3_9ACTN|nr:hypothetical protein [Catenuloplanes nepalensis]